jgi:hypothetical protein
MEFLDDSIAVCDAQLSNVSYFLNPEDEGRYFTRNFVTNQIQKKNVI